MSQGNSMEHTHLISVCVFCLLCATHIHCSEYSWRAAVKMKMKSQAENLGKNLGASRETLLGAKEAFPADVNVGKYPSVRKANDFSPSSENRARYKRNVETSAVDEQVYAERLFDKYRTSENKIDLNGFKKMLKNLRLTEFLLQEHLHAQVPGSVESLKFQDEQEEENGKRNSIKSEGKSPEKCVTAEELMLGQTGFRATETGQNLLPSDKSKSEEKGFQDAKSETFHVDEGSSFLTKDNFTEIISKLCPRFLYSLVEPSSCNVFHDHGEETLKSDRFSAWLYASISVVVISLCGLLGVFVIPIMGNVFYNQLLQFLVALAIGTLCGDALLHLLPHAMVPHIDEIVPAVKNHDHDHTVSMWKGLAALLGIVFFFLTEKVLNLGSEWRKKRQRNNKVRGHSHVQILNGNETSDSVGEKLCKHKYSSYPYCYPDIKSNKDGHEHSRTSNAGKSEYRDEIASGPESCDQWLQESSRLTENETTDNAEKQVDKEEEKGIKSEQSECDKQDGEYTVIIREHETVHHGHSHAHGHVHSAPESLSSVAWMVVLGDGLHNFTDGMAVGAAFSNNIAGGCSTAVAVFCHELPHELGDFAVLLKAGMSAKQAVFYNLMSSILCFVGMCLGIFVGDNPESTSWVFAVSAGMFLYIGLVDMFPELTTSHSAIESSLCQCSLQGLGLISGVAIMLVIAYYEDHLLNLFK